MTREEQRICLDGRFNMSACGEGDLAQQVDGTSVGCKGGGSAKDEGRTWRQTLHDVRGASLLRYATQLTRFLILVIIVLVVQTIYSASYVSNLYLSTVFSSMEYGPILKSLMARPN